ncbi:hypothetical protein LEMLEM_LOCUS1941, partial [Lemmus lemmus]
VIFCLLRSWKPDLVLFILSSLVFATSFCCSFSLMTQGFHSPKGKDSKMGYFSVAQYLILEH